MAFQPVNLEEKWIPIERLASCVNEHGSRRVLASLDTPVAGVEDLVGLGLGKDSLAVNTGLVGEGRVTNNPLVWDNAGDRYI